MVFFCSMMDGPSQHLRRHALQKIAALSAASPGLGTEESDFEKLCRLCPTMETAPLNGLTNGEKNHPSNGHTSLSKSSMTLEELDLLLALCKAGPLLDNAVSVERLVEQLSPYLLEAHAQAIAPSPFLRSIEPSPWEALTYNLVAALLAIGIKYTYVHERIYQSTVGYLRNCIELIRSDPVSGTHDSYEGTDFDVYKTLQLGAISVSVLGFLDASSRFSNFYTSAERYKITDLLRQILTENFLVSVEGAFSSIRTSEAVSREIRDWKQYTRRYAGSGRPLGAMLLQQGFMGLLVSCSSLQIATAVDLQQAAILDLLMAEKGSHSTHSEASPELVGLMSDIASEQMRLLEDGADYLQLGSAWQQRLAFAVKANALITFLCCMIVDEEVADIDVLTSWLEDSMTDSVQMADDDLASAVLKCMAVVANISPSIASALSRSLPRFIVQSGIKGTTVGVAARCLAYILHLLSQDAIITGLYSLGNVLSSGPNAEKAISNSANLNGTLGATKNSSHYTQQPSGSAISLELSRYEDSSLVYGNVVRAIVSIATESKDDKITTLALSMLIQKLGRLSLAVDLQIIIEAATLATSGGQLELKSLLKLYTKCSHDGILQKNAALLDAVMTARVHLAQKLSRDSPLFQTYLIHLLETIISKGDIHESENTHQADVELAALEICQLLRPLAILVSMPTNVDVLPLGEDVAILYREAWFNIVVHGITPDIELGQKYLNELQTLAMHSKPLVAENRADQFESDIELNTVLRRGMNAQHAAEQKRRMTRLLPSIETDIKALTYPKVIFLSAAYMVETLRADAGSCTHILSYFLDPAFTTHEMGSCMGAVADEVMTIYLRRTVTGRHEDSSAPYVAKQLALMLTGCCHRISKVQQVAVRSVDRIVSQVPSSLCQKSSLFALLELLTIMWSSCLEAEIDEYEWKSTYVSALGKVTVELSDDYDFRRASLNAFCKRAKTWLTRVISIAPLDVKGLLQTYLSEYDDEGAYGHVSLGRSFALEMGSAIPVTDHKLGAIDRHGDYNINTSSDFIAQYTTRQEYRYADALAEHDQEWTNFLQLNTKSSIPEDVPTQGMQGAQDILANLERRVLEKKFISIGEVRDVLRRAAALLCRSKIDQCAIIHYLVGIPFAIFTKQSINLGISLWLGIINENIRMEPRVLVEIAESWEHTVRNKLGVFNEKFYHQDPFYIKEEFAPSDKSILLKRQQAAHNLIAPHLRVLQFLMSHFNAIRLGSSHLRRIMQRLIRITLQGLRHSAGHPLMRELHFQIVLFGLLILRYSEDLGVTAKWRLKDSILSIALAWFSHEPRWSFGGNRLQIKAEVRLMGDVEGALQDTRLVGSKTTKALQSLATKQDLLIRLIEDEKYRLEVWLFPLERERNHIFLSNIPERSTMEINPAFAKIAWTEHPGIAIQLITRFRSPKLVNDVRWLLLNYPDKAVDEPDALQILYNDALPADVSFQLKYLLYWSPVNPITAVNYFLPAYGDHPFILQYAMRALESHSVDITFFYVPQIVQTLRYDALGYVQRYIIETAKFSQLFAHQIIWNMKANAYKDEDSTIEDPLKPTLDRVLAEMLTSFSDTDKAFYKREFSFFNEITDVSGKLRPFIKKSKPEKKQKIEEELRKIKLEQGVYLPSNPDGVVIGIDRKSGKPLQSHAKAPYMATFRIKKNRGEMEGTDDMLERTNQDEQSNVNRPMSRESTFEVWQSAIFKVGDDCRQDVLALQMIAAFRGIFNNIGLDVYVYPYRVTATAPGCGVIDVLPNSISRDMLGREAVNGLYDYFVSKYGGPESIRFQEARSNFVKSMAAYSVISYLLQFKDRHNGNIMVDDAGHILHIDFGFCFDIAPGGVRFERAPFKLTSEMVAVMGGSTTSQSYKWFEELCVKSFLASRQYAEKLCHMVVVMLDSGLPCFKPETIKHFRERFVQEKSEREAADFMKDLVKKSHDSYSTKGYDAFQLWTNGIPY